MSILDTIPGLTGHPSLRVLFLVLLGYIKLAIKTTDHTSIQGTRAKSQSRKVARDFQETSDPPTLINI